MQEKMRVCLGTQLSVSITHIIAVNAQTQELDHVRRKVYELEQAFHIMKGE
jgi:hypothetical protein